MDQIEDQVQKQLFSMQDAWYREFQSRLMPTVDKERVIGVRTPQLRSFAKEFGKSNEAEAFLQLLPHFYYEENNLHGFLIEAVGEYDKCISYLDQFLPYVDNWATCDMMVPKILKKHLPQLQTKLEEWIASEHTYMIRFGIGMLMRFYLDKEFSQEYPERVAAIHTEEYYVKMMIAWYFATALAKQYEKILPYLENGRLEKWIHNKTIQKAVESNCITKGQKEYLRSLKRK